MTLGSVAWAAGLLSSEERFQVSSPFVGPSFYQQGSNTPLPTGESTLAGRINGEPVEALRLGTKPWATSRTQFELLKAR